MRGLFVTHEGFGNSIFQSQVIEHCKSMKSVGVDIDILTYEVFRKAWSVSATNAAKFQKNGYLTLWLKKAVSIYAPFSTLINLLILAIDINRLANFKRYKFIHARADYTAFLCTLLKPIHGLPVIWDCRGDSVDELNFAIEKFSPPIYLLLYFCLIPRQRLIRFIAGRLCDYSICVSKALHSLVGSINPKLNISIIPCPVPDGKFFFSLEKRQKMRREMCIDDDELLFIYSGSMTGYQSIGEFIWYYKIILQNRRHRLLIATIDVDKAKNLFHDIATDRLTITTVSYDSMIDLYCAADYALMTRVSRNLNLVASPTKFGEYCLTGLTVIHNNSIEQVSTITASLKNGEIFNYPPSIMPSIDDRVNISKSAKKLFGRNHLNPRYIDVYSIFT